MGCCRFQAKYSSISSSWGWFGVSMSEVPFLKNITVLEESAHNPEIVIDPAAYSLRMFGMFDGKLQDITFRCPMNRVGIMIDRFGKDIVIRADGPGHCLVRTQVALSQQFFGWLTGLGSDFQIVQPSEVADAYLDHLRSIVKRIEGDT